MHPFARGNQRTKLGPKYPYSGGHNNRTEKQAAATEAFVCGHDRKHGPNISQRRIKATFKAFETDPNVYDKFGAAQRRVIRKYQAEEASYIDHQMLLNAA